MSRNNISLLAMSLAASGAVSAHRFVTPAGAQTGVGSHVLGVSQYAAADTEDFAADTLGTALVEAGAAFALGAGLVPDANGKAVTGAGAPAAMALEAATAAGQIVEVLLLPRDRKGQLVAQSNDITRYSAAGAVAISGIALVDGGTGIAGLTLAAPEPGCLCRLRLDTLTSGDVVVTTATGVTFDGTNNTATLDAAAEELILGYKSATEWEIVENVGSVALSAV